jgi:photosystem II stability/assembly factor-like uncharacterized protein
MSTPYKTICILLAFVFLFFESSSQKVIEKRSQHYQWKSVQIVGGGFVDGIIFHPKAKTVRYCRTDMGGAYRWNVQTKTWEPILDFISYEDRNLMGVESIAVDPSDSNFVVLACGTYTNPRAGNGAILRSFDGGQTFQRTDVPFKFGGNENGRGNGERMMVDPKNGNIIYLSTRLNGLWKSIDKGKTWNEVKTFPDVTESFTPTTGADSIQQRRMQFQNRGSGIVMSLFDPRNASKNYSTVYAFASLVGRNNFFKSEDDGNTWTAVPNQPTQYLPTHAVLAEDGMLYITYGNSPGPSPMTNGAVWKFNTNTGEWTDITPDKPTAQKQFGYAAVSIDAQHPQTIIVSTYNRYKAGGEEIFRSTDAGKTWKPVLKQSKFDDSIAPYVQHTGVHWMFDIEIDPFDSDHAMFTTGYGGHETFDLTSIDQNKTITWSVMSKGIEETVALELLSPPKGARLISAIGDYGGFVHWNPDKAEPAGNFINPHFGNTDGVACAEKNPDVIVRVGIASNELKEKNIGYSLDGGKTWQQCETMPTPNSAHGHIAVSADGSTWIWTPQRSSVFATHDHGKSWQQSKGIADNLRVIADKVNPKKFYALSLLDGKLYVSNDEGNSFTEQALSSNIKIPNRGSQRGDVRGGQDRIYATPGKEGDLWLAAFDGLYHSTDGSNSFVTINNVTEIHAFGFGKAAPHSKYPSLYLIGVVNGVRGIFRSDNIAKTWIRINDDQHQWALLLHVTGDSKKYGRVYVGTHGRGIIYGDPE